MTTKRSPLQTIADEMRQRAALKPYVDGANVQAYRRKLAGGALVEFLLDGKTHEWSFAIVRARQYPSIQEIGYLKSVFAVPAGAWEKRYKNGDRFVVRWRWKAEIKENAIHR